MPKAYWRHIRRIGWSIQMNTADRLSSQISVAKAVASKITILYSR